MYNPAKKIEDLSKLFAGYAGVFFDLEDVIQRIRVDGDIGRESEKSYASALNRLAELSAADEPDTDESLLVECQEKVNKQFPVDSFWWPPVPSPAT